MGCLMWFGLYFLLFLLFVFEFVFGDGVRIVVVDMVNWMR